MSQTKAQLIDPVDGTIVNADINASAAIAGSKISPDFGSQNIVTTGGLTVDTTTLHVNTSNNRVGIGTTSPSSPLEISSASNPVIKATSSSSSVGAAFTAQGGSSNDSQLVLSSGTTAKYTILRDGSQSDDLRIYDSANALDIIRYRHGSYLHFGVNGSERMRINSSGNVGIGTTSPSEKIHITDGNLRLKSSNTSGYKVKIGNAATGDDDFLGAVSGFWNDNEVAIVGFRSGTDTTNKDDGMIFFGTSESGSNPSTRMTIRESGKVGIGTTSPSNILHIKDGNPYLEIEGTSNSGDAGIFFNAKSNHWNLRADNSGSQNSFGLKSGTPASSTHTISIVGQTIDFFQNRNIYQRVTSGTMAIADGANKQFTITGLGYGWAKLQLAFYGEGQFCNVEVTVGGLMASGSQYYSATIIANGSSGSCDVAFGANQTSYVVTISNNVGNGGSMHGTALFTGSGGSAHPNIAVS